LDKMNAVRRSVLLSALILATAAAPTVARADMGTEVPNEGGIGAVAALSTLIYGPVKLTYATLGLLVGGAAWGLSGGDQQVLEAVVTPALRGDYVVTPEHIRMERGIEFYGRDPQYREVQQASAAPPDAALQSADY
jgi:hypothetical protein